MNLRFSLASAVAVALVFGATSTASAQADTTRRTTTSQTRVRVTKESQGEVSIRRDSAFIRDSIARADSLARMEKMRQDSIARADSLARLEQIRRDSIARDSSARADSIARASQTDTIRTPVTPTMSTEQYGTRRGGWYLGLGAGPNVPTGTVNDFYKTGFNVTVPIGYQPLSSPLGFRVDLGYSRFNGREPGTNGLSAQPDDPNIWSATANLTLDLMRFGAEKRGALYLVGGGGVFRFTDFFNTDRSDNDVESAFEGSPVTKAGLTGGAGLAFPIGKSSLFVESRYTTAYTEGEQTRWVPVVIGLKWR
jgi:opacity protein-like surface antigen